MSAEFKNYVENVKRQLTAAFAQGLQYPIPGNDLILEELVNVNQFMKLGPTIDRYFQPWMRKPPRSESEGPSLRELLRFLEKEWLPNLLEQTTEGLRLTLNITGEDDATLSFSLGLSMTEDALQTVQGNLPTEDLLAGLAREFEPPRPGLSGPGQSPRRP